MIDALLRFHRKLGIKYRLARRWGYIRRFGWLGARAARRALWKLPTSDVHLAVPGVDYPITLRSGTPDASTLEKVFVWNGYEINYSSDPKVIIDAGANIGLSAVFFAGRFPGAIVIAIEPEARNFELLCRNTCKYQNIVPVRAALWSDDGTVGLIDSNERVDSYRFAADATQGNVEAISVPSLLERYGIGRVDVLKIDIEGAETVVFRNAPTWVERVGMFIIELHDSAATEAFTSATGQLCAYRYRRGENHVVDVDGRAAQASKA